VAMGGSDFLKLTSPIVDGLKDLDIAICVAIGPTNSQRQQIEETVKSIPRARVILQANYITELASSSLAILAAGSSLWEAAALGVPSIGLIVADNQSESARAAEIQLSMPVIDVRIKLNLDLLLDLAINGLSAGDRRSLNFESIVHGANVAAKMLSQLATE